MAKKGMEQALMSPQEKKLKAAAMSVLEEKQESQADNTPAAVPEESKKVKATGRTGKTARIDLRVKEGVKADLIALASLNDMSITEYIESLVANEKKKNRRKLASTTTGQE